MAYNKKVIKKLQILGALEYHIDSYIVIFSPGSFINEVDFDSLSKNLIHWEHSQSPPISQHSYYYTPSGISRFFWTRKFSK